MRSTTLLTAFTLLATSALAVSPYPPNPAKGPHRVALIGLPKKNDVPTSTSPELSCTTPKPWPFKCGVPGNLTQLESTITFSYTNTFNECRDLCVNNSTCSAFGFRDDYNTCTTMLQSLKANGFVADAMYGSSGWWNRKCFACELVGNGTNFVNNGDFATGTLQYWEVGSPDVLPGADNGTNSGVSSPGFSNDNYTFYGNIPEARNVIFLSQDLDTIANVTYNITFDYTVSNSDVMQAIYFLAGDDDMSGSSQFVIPPASFEAGQWQSASGTYMAQENTTIGFVLATSGNQTFYIDSVTVQEILD